MTRAFGKALHRSIALLLFTAAVGLTFGAPVHARHDTAADPTHQRACAVVAWTKAVQAAAVTPPVALTLTSVVYREDAVQRSPSTPELSRRRTS